VELGIQEFEREEVQLQIFENITTVPDGLECAIRLLKSPQPPTGFLCALDLSALGVIRATKQLGLIPGEHVSVIGYEGIPEGDFSEPGLTTFEVDQYEAGFQCGVKLMQLIHEKGAKVSGTLTMAVLLERGSDGPVRFTSTELATFIRNRKRLLSSQEKLHRMTEKSLRN
jgi:LacI family transcriptional regulator